MYFIIIGIPVYVVHTAVHKRAYANPNFKKPYFLFYCGVGNWHCTSFIMHVDVYYILFQVLANEFLFLPLVKKPTSNGLQLIERKERYHFWCSE